MERLDSFVDNQAVLVFCARLTAARAASLAVLMVGLSQFQEQKENGEARYPNETITCLSLLDRDTEVVKERFMGEGKGRAMRRQQIWPRIWILTLLAILLSYSLDFECLLEAKSCQQAAASSNASSTCGEPKVGPSPAILPEAPIFHGPILLYTAYIPEPTKQVRHPVNDRGAVPLGLRAPPLI